MTMPALWLWVSGLAATMAVLGLRAAWSRQHRSTTTNALCWGLTGLALAIGWGAGGAWGMAVVSLAGTACAFILLGQAAITAPTGKASASTRRAHMLPEKGERLHLWRRIATLILCVPVALAVALLLALAARQMASAAGWGEADSNVLALFLMPLFWSLLLFALLMTHDRRVQSGLLAALAIIPILILLLERLA